MKRSEKSSVGLDRMDHEVKFEIDRHPDYEQSAERQKKAIEMKMSDFLYEFGECQGKLRFIAVGLDSVNETDDKNARNNMAYAIELLTDEIESLSGVIEKFDLKLLHDKRD